MRNALTVAALLLAFSYPVSAGIVNNPGSPQPAPSPTPVCETSTASTAEEEPTSVDSSDGAALSLTEIALEILTVLPSLL